MHPEWKDAYLVVWRMELPVQPSEMSRTLKRLQAATTAVFNRHRILSARICQDKNGALFKYDSGESPVI